MADPEHTPPVTPPDTHPATPPPVVKDIIIEIIVGTEDVGHFFLSKQVLVENSKFFEAEVKKLEEQVGALEREFIIRLPDEEKEVFHAVIKWFNNPEQRDRWLMYSWTDPLETYKLIETLKITGYKNGVMDVIRRRYRNRAAIGQDVAKACKMFPDPASPVRNFFLDQLAYFLRFRHSIVGCVWEPWTRVPKESYDLLPELVEKIIKNPLKNASFLEGCVYHDHEGETGSCDEFRKHVSQLRKRRHRLME